MQDYVDKFVESDIVFFSYTNSQKPVRPPKKLISEYAEQKRILPANTPFPGQWRNTRTPFWVEVMDNMSPFSPIQHQAVMKGAQIGVTASAENVVAYWMDENPCPIMVLSATDGLLEEWSSKRLEPLIDSCGFRDKIASQTESAKSRRSGDKTLSKEFPGGFVLLVSLQSPGKQRSSSIRLMVRDEIDGAPLQLRSGEGSFLEVSGARTDAFGARSKIFDISTPTIWGQSAIHDEYLEGDQRNFFIPCPLCGKMQVLKMGNDKTQYGIKPDTKAGELVNVYYMCEFCHDAIFNHHKTKMFNSGVWKPTAKSSSIDFRSYHLPSLYSPVGMLSWEKLWRKYLKAQLTPDGMRSFVNLCLGLPYKETGMKPKREKVIELRSAYKAGSVQDGVLYLTAFVDVQSGSKKDKGNPPRLEMEVCGIGAGYRTWSVIYRVFEGEVDDPYSGAWESMHQWAIDGGMVFKRKDGVQFSIKLCFIDSGDGNLTDVVYRFCERWQNTYPSKGFSALKRRKKEKKDQGDEAGPENFKRYRAAKLDGGRILYEISTNYYKTHIYNNLKIERQDIDPQRPGFCEFPFDYGEKYFDMLIAEVKHKDGSFHNPTAKRNEALDCRVGCLCAADVWLDARVLEVKAEMKSRGATVMQLQEINHRFIIEKMKEAFKVSY